jgi:hypothetical protein
MKKTRVAIFGVVTLLAMGAVVFGVSMIANGALGQHKEAAKTTCNGDHSEYIVTIQDAKLSIDDIHAKLCDKLTIINADNTLRLMAFGVHDHHQPYDGIEEKLLKQNDQLSVTLQQTGTFTFHDHLHDEVQGTFTVE